MGAVDLEVRDGVAHLMLNRPDAANAIDLTLARELRAAVEQIAAEDAARAVVLSGAGKRFCGGGDVASFVEVEDRAAYLLELATEADAAARALADLAKPVVAAVHGAVAGAGLALMLSADVVIAATGTKFVFAYPGIGLTPDCGVSYLLPRAIGQQRALAFALANRPIMSPTAQEWGMVAEVAGDQHETLARASAMAAGWAAGPAAALGEARRLLRAGWELDRVAVGAEEAATIARAVVGDEAVALVDRFLGR